MNTAKIEELPQELREWLEWNNKWAIRFRSKVTEPEQLFYWSKSEIDKCSAWHKCPNKIQGMPVQWRKHHQNNYWCWIYSWSYSERKWI